MHRSLRFPVIVASYVGYDDVRVGVVCQHQNLEEQQAGNPN
jgi:hypothetical protein